MSEQCEYCGHELSLYPDSQPYGMTWVDTSYELCENPECLGEKEPQCGQCGIRQWINGEELITDRHGTWCEYCISEQMERLGAVA